MQGLGSYIRIISSGAAQGAGRGQRGQVPGDLAADAEVLEVVRKLRHADKPVRLAGVVPVLLQCHSTRVSSSKTTRTMIDLP